MQYFPELMESRHYKDANLRWVKQGLSKKLGMVNQNNKLDLGLKILKSSLQCIR